MSGSVKIVGESVAVVGQSVSDTIGQNLPDHQEAIKAERVTCQNPNCNLMAYSVRNLEKETLALGAFCINRCDRLSEVVVDLRVSPV